MPFDDYCRLPGINASAVKGVGGCSPRHLKAYLDGDLPNEDSAAKRLGRAIHCLILEPDRFEESFPTVKQCWAVVKGDVKKGTDEHRCYNQGTHQHNDLFYCGVHGKAYEELADYITKDEETRLAALKYALRSDPCAEYLRRPGHSEIVIQWNQYGLQLKTRIDRLAITGTSALLLDIKKMRVGYGSDDQCRKECADRGYHLQAIFHWDGVRAAFGELDVQQFFLFVEDDYPFCTNMLPVDDEDRRIATEVVSSKLSVFKACQATGVYHGYQIVVDPEKQGILPMWLRNQYIQEIEVSA